MYTEVNGDLIKLAKEGNFDVITHGNNCMCNMGAGIAPQMARAFGCDRYKMEDPSTRGDINKLGQIEYKTLLITSNGLSLQYWVTENKPKGSFLLTVVNSYSQYIPSAHLKPLDYEALTLCLRKINHIFKGKRIGLPQIGAGLAGGDWVRIKEIIITELKDCDVTVVIFKKDNN
jgi:O-acetyl-ADP-ribose deacetylase (regulator of RNase III)